MRIAPFITTLTLLLSTLYVLAQSVVPDSAMVKPNMQKADTIRVKNKASVQPVDSVKKELHSPRKATLRSLMIPGWGQAYNKKYWKIPVIYVGAAALVYGFAWNHNQYKDFRQLAIYINDGDSTTIPVYNGRVLNSGYSNWAAGNRDYFRKNRDLCAIGLVAVYVLNVVDATVDAHLFEFNINDDLSLRWQPNFWMQQNHMYAGIGATIKLK